MTEKEQAGSPAPATERLHIGVHALATPGKLAAVEVATGRTRTFDELEDRSARFAYVLADSGIDPGGHVAAMLVNQLEYFDVAWATQRSGLWLTPVNWHLTPAEAGYIVTDCEAQALVTTRALAIAVGPDVARLAAPGLRLVTDDAAHTEHAGSGPSRRRWRAPRGTRVVPRSKARSCSTPQVRPADQRASSQVGLPYRTGREPASTV
jgi:acyl-CoA synthetase (AMP-forming)/AMP-acid ligase II